VNIALVVRNWLFGWYIVEFEKGGAKRTELYGKKRIKQLSEELGRRGLKGVSAKNLKQFRLFYLTYQKIGQTVSAQSLEMPGEGSETHIVIFHYRTLTWCPQ